MMSIRATRRSPTAVFPSRRARWFEQLERREMMDAAPKVVLISLDGATPRLIDQYLQSGVLSANSGLGYLRSHGLVAEQNVTVNPSLTAPGHIAIATGSSAAKNDV